MRVGSKKILAVASGGGHWLQILRLRPAFDGCRVAFVTVSKAYRADVGDSPFYVVNDATRWDKVGLVKMALRIAWIMLRERPHTVISTGAAPGYFAMRIGKLLRARTVWIDSIANADRMSMSGELVRKYADLWLTQWPHLAGRDGPKYAGSVL